MLMFLASGVIVLLYQTEMPAELEKPWRRVMDKWSEPVSLYTYNNHPDGKVYIGLKLHTINVKMSLNSSEDHSCVTILFCQMITHRPT